MENFKLHFYKLWRKKFSTYFYLLFLYAKLLKEWNSKMNLTAIDEREEVYEKHFFDSILPLNDSIQGKAADVGTGAGFPGVVWKIVRKDLEVSLRLYFASFAACTSNLHAY